MAKFFKTSLILLALAVAACSAEAPRYRPRKFQAAPSRQRLFARQELAPAPTPYPSAAELKPEVPFGTAELADGAQPDLTYGPPEQTYGPPDQTYGPPEVEQLPSETAPEEFASNPDAEDFLPAEPAAPVESAAEEAPLPARLTQRRRRVQKLAKVQQQRKPVLKQKQQQRLVSAPVNAVVPAPIAVAPLSLPLQAQQQQQYYVLNSPFAYTAQFQTW